MLSKENSSEMITNRNIMALMSMTCVSKPLTTTVNSAANNPFPLFHFSCNSFDPLLILRLLVCGWLWGLYGFNFFHFASLGFFRLSILSSAQWRWFKWFCDPGQMIGASLVFTLITSAIKCFFNVVSLWNANIILSSVLETVNELFCITSITENFTAVLQFN